MKHVALSLIWLVLLSTTVNAAAQTQTDEVAALIEAGKYQEAVQMLQKLAKSTKGTEPLSYIYHRLGEIYYTYTHEYPQALKAYDKVIELRKKGLSADDLFLAYIKKGDTYCRMGQYDDAVDAYQTLVKQFPAEHFAHQTGLQKTRNVQTALEDLREQQTTMHRYDGKPLAIEAQFQIAELYRSHYQLNQPEQAIAEYQTLLTRYPDAKIAPQAQWRVGNLRHKVLNQPALAVAAYQKVVDNYPTSNFAADALFQIAYIHGTQGRHELAAALLEELPQKYPDFWNMHAVFYWSGFCYENLHDYRRALRGFKTFLHVYLPNLDPAYFGVIGKHDQSQFQIETELRAKIQRLQADLPKMEWERIDVLIKKGDYATALPLAQQLIADIPDSEYAKRAKSQLTSLEQHAAIQNLWRRIQDSPNTPTAAHAQFQLATIYERNLQDYAQAIEAYRQVIENYPESAYAAEAMYRTGTIHAEHLDAPQKAIQHYQTLIQRYPASAQIMMANFQLGELYRALHRYDEAVKSYQTTIAYPERDLYLAEGYKDSFADRARFRIGRVHYEDRRYDDALTAFKEFIENRPRSPRLAAAYVYLAFIHQERGGNRAAADAYAKARSLTIKSRIQAEMVVDEAHPFGFQGADPQAVIQRLDELHERVSQN